VTILLTEGMLKYAANEPSLVSYCSDTEDFVIPIIRIIAKNFSDSDIFIFIRM
jgi:hypothetical protein